MISTSKTQNVLSDHNSSFTEKCEEFAEILGLDEPIPEDVLIAAINNETYSYNLLVSSSSKEMLNYLIQNPPKPKKAENLRAPDEQQNPEKSNKDLIVKATKALYNWSKTGFSTVDEDVLKRREDACLSCPNLSTPTSMLQKMASSQKISEKTGRRAADKTCNLCGCNIGRKIKMTSESCPGVDPENPNLTRWGDPLPKK